MYDCQRREQNSCAGAFEFLFCLPACSCAAIVPSFEKFSKLYDRHFFSGYATLYGCVVWLALIFVLKTTWSIWTLSVWIRISNVLPALRRSQHGIVCRT